MTIKRLPQHLINKLKAGEIVERPSSVVKELIENSLDAGAADISVEISGGGKKLIKIQDNGRGLSESDLQLSIERYATSKITDDSDLERIDSYGFRGEALASISEVSVFRIQSKYEESESAFELYRSGDYFHTKQIPFAGDHGTIVYVQDIFHHIPAREKFLKTDVTERKYIKDMFLQYAIVHFEKKRTLIKDGKILYTFLPAKSLLERLLSITKKDREKNLKEVAYQDEQLHLYGVAGDASLHFATGQYFRLFVNGRPVQDKLLKRAVMQAYQRQIVPGSYPFICLFLDIDPKMVDVNVHPRKLEVKFLDPGSIFTRVNESIIDSIGNKKVNYAAFNQKEIRKKSSVGYHHSSPRGMSESQIQTLHNMGNVTQETGMFTSTDVDQISFGELRGEGGVQFIGGNELYTLVGQIRQSYILLESENALVYIDQHALAERIAFEQIKKNISTHGFSSEVLLQPLKLEVPGDVDSEKSLKKLETIGFDVAEIGLKKIVIYAVPKVFHKWKVDIELIVNWVWSNPTGSTGEDFFKLMIDEMVGMKACKASIKAGQKLNQLEMKQLVQDGFTHISGMFVCQHGRPSAVRIEKNNIDGLFER